MQGKLKTFDEELFDTTDEVTREAVKSLLAVKLPHLTHIDNPHQFGIDLLSTDQSGVVVYAWEVENRIGVWKEHMPNFPFSSVNCIERKIDMMQFWTSKVGGGLQISPYARPFYVQTRADNKRCIIVKGSQVLEYGKQRVDWKNRYVKDGVLEKVAQVPTSECTHYDL